MHSKAQNSHHGLPSGSPLGFQSGSAGAWCRWWTPPQFSSWQLILDAFPAESFLGSIGPGCFTPDVPCYPTLFTHTHARSQSVKGKAWWPIPNCHFTLGYSQLNARTHTHRHTHLLIHSLSTYSVPGPVLPNTGSTGGRDRVLHLGSSSSSGRADI